MFSSLTFTDGLDALYRPLKEGTIFQNPVSHMYAVFSYDGMVRGSQWTALWYRNGELVHYETLPWDGDTGGLGYTDWQPPPEEWLPGLYEVQIFTGLTWKVSGTFTVEGDAPTPRADRYTHPDANTYADADTHTHTTLPTRHAHTPSAHPSPLHQPDTNAEPHPLPHARTPVTPSITPQSTRTRAHPHHPLKQGTIRYSLPYTYRRGFITWAIWLATVALFSSKPRYRRAGFLHR